MDYFGDESGHLRSVLQQEAEVCVIAVVGGDRVSCSRCPKQAVRNVTDIDEAKWNDLLETQKRRLFECFAENDHLQFGYARFTREQLKSVNNDYLLFQDVDLPPAWDLALSGYAYGEILFDMGALDERRSVFCFDRISSQKQCEAVADHVSEIVPDTKVTYEGSKQVDGIQAADCLAGAVAEDYKRDTDWLGYLDDEDVVQANYMSLAKLEADLHGYDTAP
jgi:hypothetical protein